MRSIIFSSTIHKMVYTKLRKKKFYLYNRIGKGDAKIGYQILFVIEFHKYQPSAVFFHMRNSQCLLLHVEFYTAYFKSVFASAYISAKKVVINTVYLNSNWG